MKISKIEPYIYMIDFVQSVNLLECVHKIAFAKNAISALYISTRKK